MRGLLWLGLGLWLSGCLPDGPPGVDIEPPVVVRFAPIGEAVDPQAVIRVQFSEPVDAEAWQQPLVAVIPEDRLDLDFLDDFDRPPLAAKRADIPLACALQVDGQDTRLNLVPEQGLEPGGLFVVVVSAAVSDLAGNPLVDEARMDEHGRVVGVQSHVLHRFGVRPASDDPADDPADDPSDDPNDDPSDDPNDDPNDDPIDDPIDDPAGPPCRLLLTEVMANPAGTESEGEYLEVANLDERPQQMEGWLLSDSGLAGEGDLLGACPEGGPVSLPAGGLALIVGRSFVPPADLAPDCVLVCTDRSTLTARGLRNSGGEVLVLSAADGGEVDRYGGWLDLSSGEGCSAMRLDLQAPDGPENWAQPSGDPCRSPGWIE